jgi:hypothetical protein
LEKKEMKKIGASRSPQTKNMTSVPPLTDYTWEDVAKFTPMVFHTLGRGLVIGFVEGMNDLLIRVHAPACIQEMPASNAILPPRIAFVPLFGVGRFMDLRQSVVFATMPVPKIFLEGYLGYFEQFAKGSYNMKPVVVSAGIDAPEGVHTVDIPPETSIAPQEESPAACPQDSVTAPPTI